MSPRRRVSSRLPSHARVHAPLRELAELARSDTEMADTTTGHALALTNHAKRLATTSAILRLMAQDTPSEISGDTERSPIITLVREAHRYAETLRPILERMPLEEYARTGYREVGTPNAIRSLGRLFGVDRVTAFDPPKFSCGWDQKIDEDVCRLADEVQRLRPATNTVAMPSPTSTDSSGWRISGIAGTGPATR